MKKIKRALISVSDKNNLKFLIKNLSRYKIKIISSGGTYKEIKKMGFKCEEVSKYTKNPEILSGRVKTLHPKIYAGILAKRKLNSHKNDLKKNNYDEIDLVIVNFYPFEQTVKQIKNDEKILENIDIGGPTMVRAAAKNYKDVTVITNISQYESLLKNINQNRGATSLEFRKKAALEAFGETAYYESLIYKYFRNLNSNEFPSKFTVGFNLIEKLRYGENPHQQGAVYSASKNLNLDKLNGKQLSYNNYSDIFAALQISKTFPNKKGTVIVKHGNPCGVSVHENNIQSFLHAYKCDPLSAFGGILSCNFRINKKLALELNKLFFEVIIANEFDKDALYLLKRKKNLRLINSKNYKISNNNNLISNMDFALSQNPDVKNFNYHDFKVVSKNKPNKKTFDNLIFAFNVCRFVKSNAIVLTNEKSTVGIGSGQPSRLDSCDIAIKKMNLFHNLSNKEILAASDAFFPFIDGIEKLVQNGVSGIIQPSGSIRDREVINFANKTGTVLIFSKTRHFKH